MLYTGKEPAGLGATKATAGYSMAQAMDRTIWTHKAR